MKFKYLARNKEGELQGGFVDAAGRDGAANILTGHELFVLSLESADKKRITEKVFSFLNRVKAIDVMVFTRQFATLLESEVPLSDSIRALYKQTKNPLFKEAIFEISADIDAGLSLSQALGRQNHIFSEFYLNMIRSAEVTARLKEAMIFLADYMEKEVGLRMKIKNALIYPAFIIVLFLAVAVIILTVVFPKLAPVFEEMNVRLPLLTKILLNSGGFILEWWWLIIIIGWLFIGLMIDYFRTPEGKIVFSELIIRTPVFGDLFKKNYVARFAESLSVLIKGGIPLSQSLEITGRVIGNEIYAGIIEEIAEKVKAGESLSSLLSQNEYYFPALVGQMVSIGENTGRLDEILLKVAAFFTREVENVVNNLTELIQPVLITVIGILVGLLFAAILLPIYNLTQGLRI
ncbi:MAG: type II secretion system F family protein [Patescibacteria group bacterium]